MFFKIYNFCTPPPDVLGETQRWYNKDKMIIRLNLRASIWPNNWDATWDMRITYQNARVWAAPLFPILVSCRCAPARYQGMIQMVEFLTPTEGDLDWIPGSQRWPGQSQLLRAFGEWVNRRCISLCMPLCLSHQLLNIKVGYIDIYVLKPDNEYVGIHDTICSTFACLKISVIKELYNTI